MPYMLELFTHPGCISSEVGKRQIESILKDFHAITFREINLLEDYQRAASLGIKMSPTLVLDGKILSVGMPSPRELKELLRKALIGVSRVS